MWFLHYILPLAIYFFIKKDKTILYGLLAGNLIDLDKIYYRIIGKVDWFGSICPEGIGTCTSINNYPLHNILAFNIFLVSSLILYFLRRKNNKLKFLFWLMIGTIIHLFLDYIQHITGIII
ncbi:hypothetical protein HOA59_00630 [archaeon]|jgi:hypothetical protein|nr:hypothetical protein [archaeon]MBT6823925.1 hypothetical protein [archaeon]MBT7106827.1 hypothetical protein [archaeon]MBT7297502.1 hypothetical protein [archaeon]